MKLEWNTGPFEPTEYGRLSAPTGDRVGEPQVELITSRRSAAPALIAKHVREEDSFPFIWKGALLAE